MSELLEKLVGQPEEVTPEKLVGKDEPGEKPEEQEKPEPEQEDTKQEEKPVEEERKPRSFDANHPRFKRVWKELEELRAWKQSQEEREQERQKQQSAPQPTQAEMPQEFVSLFGENPDAWKQMEKMLSARDTRTLEQAEARFKSILEAQQESAKREQEAQAKAVQIVEDIFLDLEDETGVGLTDRSNSERNQILDICEKYQLYTPDQLPNIRAAFELHKQLYPKTDVAEIEEKRKVAAKTNVKTNSSAKESDVFTPSKLKEIDRRGGVHFFGS